MATSSQPSAPSAQHLSLEDVIQMTLRDGENWALAHARRVLRLIDEIGADLPRDDEALTLAVFLHDWGAFPCYAQKGIEHALRSRQVAEQDILPRMDLRPEQHQLVLQAIELHDYRDTRPAPSNEALLLREADMLDFLGAIGTAREFARGPRDLLACLRRVQKRQVEIQDRFTLPRAREIALQRLQRMEQFSAWLQEEGFGLL